MASDQYPWALNDVKLSQSIKEAGPDATEEAIREIYVRKGGALRAITQDNDESMVDENNLDAGAEEVVEVPTDEVVETPEVTDAPQVGEQGTAEETTPEPGEDAPVGEGQGPLPEGEGSVEESAEQA